MNNLLDTLREHGVTIYLILLGIGLLWMWNRKCKQCKELKEENEDLRRIRE